MKKLNLAMLSILLLQFFIPSSESIASLVADEEDKVTILTENYTQYLQEGLKVQFTIVPENSDQNKIHLYASRNLDTKPEAIRHHDGGFKFLQFNINTGDSEFIFTKKDARIFLSTLKGKPGVEIEGLDLLGL